MIVAGSAAQQGLTVGDPTAMEPKWNADRQVNARNRFAREILRCKNHPIRPAPIEIVSIGHEIVFARRAVLVTVFLDRAAFKVLLEQDIARRVARHGGRGDNAILELLECGRVSVAMQAVHQMILTLEARPQRGNARQARSIHLLIPREELT